MFTSMIILLRGIWRLLLRLFKLKEKYHRTLLVRCLKFVLFCTNCINCRIFFYYFLILVPCVLLLIWLLVCVCAHACGMAMWGCSYWCPGRFSVRVVVGFLGYIYCKDEWEALRGCCFVYWGSLGTNFHWFLIMQPSTLLNLSRMRRVLEIW